MTTPLPVGLALTVDPGVRRYRDGRVLVGGHPRRVMRLSDAGVAALTTLETGGEAGEATRVLGRRLVDAGLAHPRPSTPTTAPDVTTVIPVRDRAAELDRCLASLAGTTPVVVVDDGSADADAVAAVCVRHGADLLRRRVPGGPAAARNDGLAVVTTALVAFLDSDCEAPADWVQRLSGWFDDPLVGAVAPRVRSVEGPGFVGRYAAGRSPLDMGPDPRQVHPGYAVSYVPTAALVVRRAALDGGFDPALRYGEDVDLIWRTIDAGWRVRYEPSTVVRHTDPEEGTRLLRRRFAYGSSAGPLARRHGDRLAPAVFSPVPTVVAALLLGRRPLLAAGLVAGRSALLARRLHRSGAPARLAPGWTLRSVGQTFDGLARAGTMLAAPVLLVGPIVRPRWRAPVAALLLGTSLTAWARHGRGHDPVRWIVAARLDDVAYGSGVWWGAIRSGAPQALLPVIGGGTDARAVVTTAGERVARERVVARARARRIRRSLRRAP